MSEEQQVSNEPVGNEDTKVVEAPIADASNIAESKKYRKRSQAAESLNVEKDKIISDLQAKINSFEDKRLLEKEEFKTLYEKVSVENEANKALADKWTNHEATEREMLLKQVPENEKAAWESSPLNLLKLHVSKANTIQPQNPEHVVAKTRDLNIKSENWASMDSEIRRNNWSEIVNSFNNKN